MTISKLEALRSKLKDAEARETLKIMLDHIGFWDILAERDALRTERDRLQQALGEYANPINWEMDAENVWRVWLEPGSSTPDSYDGFHLARAALKEQAA